MTHLELRRKFIEFWKAKNHVEIPSSSLVPENDPTTLFVSSGMQPLINYFLGQPHPEGKRIVDSQKCLRVEDIDETGDNRHTTFFEMLGNWSFGDYFKEEQLSYFFEFLTMILNLDPSRLYVTAFAGDTKNKVLVNGKYFPMGPDEEVIKIWKKLFSKLGINAKEIELGSLANAGEVGMQGGNIFLYDVKKNWWSRSGAPDLMPVGEPGGPDSEVFYEFPQVAHNPDYGKYCHPNCDCGRFVELGNSVFMQYKKYDDGVFVELPSKNVDFGGGLERQLSAVGNNPDIFSTDIFAEAKKALEEIDTVQSAESKKSIRVILDHLRAAIFIIDAGVLPSNKDRGYILRRLIRRAMLYAQVVNIDLDIQLQPVVNAFCDIYRDIYPSIAAGKGQIFTIINDEFEKFKKTLDLGIRKLLELKPRGEISGTMLFDLYQTYGYPIELAEEFARKNGLNIDQIGFEEAKKKHQELSRTASAGMFKGGLADHSEIVTKYHTATHLLQAALRKILGDHVHQEGSNITAERLRFDFSHGGKLTPDEIAQVENLVNEKINSDLPRKMETISYDEAIKSGALAFFKERYPEKVTVYSFGDPSTSSGQVFSKEICGGPHVERTGILGKFKITKEESVSSGIRRIYATLSN